MKMRETSRAVDKKLLDNNNQDTSVYLAAVAMSQPWTYRYPLIDLHGNKGDYDGLPPAAARYTEMRLEKLAETDLQGINENAVEMVPNYSETMDEPVVLPSVFPNLLCNGTYGIAVGYMTLIPSHNLNEVADAIIATIKKQDITIDELMKYIKGPDYNIGSYLIDNEEIKKLYTTGKGKLSYKAKYHIEDTKKGKQIVITELPPEVSKPNLLEKLYDLCFNKKSIPRVASIKDLSTDIYHIQIVIELQKTAVVDVVLNALFDKSDLSTNVSYVIRALDNNVPKLFSLKECIEHYINHRRHCIYNETLFNVEKTEHTLHIKEGILKAVLKINSVIKIIQSSTSRANAKEKLMEILSTDSEQTDAILEIKLYQLTAMDKDALKANIDSLKEQINHYNDLLTDSTLIDKLIIEQLRDLKKKYGDDRRTEIIKEAEAIEEVSNEEMIFVYTGRNHIKHYSEELFLEMLAKGSLKERTDAFKYWITGTMQDSFLIITEDNNYTILTFNELLSFESKEKIVYFDVFKKSEDDILFITKKGTLLKLKENGFTSKSKFAPVFKKLENDSIASVKRVVSSENNVVTVATGKGLIQRFFEQSVNSLLRPNKNGVAGIKLKDDDSVVDMQITDKNEDSQYKLIIFNKLNNGKSAFKVLALNEFNVKCRTAQGVSALKFSAKAPGKVDSIKLISPTMSQLETSIVDSKGNIQEFKYDVLNNETKIKVPSVLPFDLI